MSKQMFTVQSNCDNIYLLLSHRLLCKFNITHNTTLILTSIQTKNKASINELYYNPDNHTLSDIECKHDLNNDYCCQATIIA